MKGERGRTGQRGSERSVSAQRASSSSYLISWLCYLVLCLRDPHATLGLAQGENIDIVNVATNANQANKVFFAKLTSRLKRPCFNRFKPKFLKGLIEFEQINLRLHSLHAANESWEGLNLLGWVMDEASAFRTLGGEDNAQAVYGTLHSSALSRFRGYHWMGLIISFARRQEGDFTLAKYEQAKTSGSMYGDKAATWEVNPTYEEGHPMYRPFSWKVVEELNLQVPDDLYDDFVTDPTDAKTKYMCEPPPQEGAFFELPHKVAEAQSAELPRVIATQTVRELEMELPEGPVTRRFVRLEIDQLPPRQDDCNYFMHGDPGLTSDAFALCLCHTTPASKTVIDADGQERELKQVVVDFVLAWQPRTGVPVDVVNVNEVILKVARYYSVRHVTFDKWNSASSVQMLVNNGIFSKREVKVTGANRCNALKTGARQDREADRGNQAIRWKKFYENLQE